MSRPKKKLKRDIKAQQTEEVVKETAKVIDNAEVESKQARDVAMFKAWLLGKSFEDLAQEYGISKTSVAVVSKKYNWKSLKKELRARQFNAALDKVRDMTIMIQTALEKDIEKIVAEATANNRMLTKEERDHLRSMYDRTLKEIRLDEGKPTEISTGGPVQVEIILPPGAKRFGVLPPDSSGRTIEVSKTEVKTIDLDQVQDEIKDNIK